MSTEEYEDFRDRFYLPIRAIFALYLVTAKSGAVRKLFAVATARMMDSEMELHRQLNYALHARHIKPLMASMYDRSKLQAHVSEIWLRAEYFLRRDLSELDAVCAQLTSGSTDALSEVRAPSFMKSALWRRFLPRILRLSKARQLDILGKRCSIWLNTALDLVVEKASKSRGDHLWMTLASDVPAIADVMHGALRHALCHDEDKTPAPSPDLAAEAASATCATHFVCLALKKLANAGVRTLLQRLQQSENAAELVAGARRFAVRKAGFGALCACAASQVPADVQLRAFARWLLAMACGAPASATVVERAVGSNARHLAGKKNQSTDLTIARQMTRGTILSSRGVVAAADWSRVRRANQHVSKAEQQARAKARAASKPAHMPIEHQRTKGSDRALSLLLQRRVRTFDSEARRRGAAEMRRLREQAAELQRRQGARARAARAERMRRAKLKAKDGAGAGSGAVQAAPGQHERMHSMSWLVPTALSGVDKD